LKSKISRDLVPAQGGFTMAKYARDTRVTVVDNRGDWYDGQILSFETVRTIFGFKTYYTILLTGGNTLRVHLFFARILPLLKR
jgi:hypothetical protein